MNSQIERKLKNYMFPIEQGNVFYSDPETLEVKRAKNYKAVIRSDNGKLISVMNDTYKVVSNREVMMPLLDELSKLDTKWIIDPSHSFVTDRRFRLQITFPDLTLNDNRSDIALSLYLHNSYDGSEGIRMYWGAIRFICTNGMVFGNVLSKFYARHTTGLNIQNIKEELQSTYEKIPKIKERIDQLLHKKADDEIKNKIEDELGKTVSSYISSHKEVIHQWALYNIITYYISHQIDKRLRAGYQMKLSRIFQL